MVNGPFGSIHSQSNGPDNLNMTESQWTCAIQGGRVWSIQMDQRWAPQAWSLQNFILSLSLGEPCSYIYIYIYIMGGAHMRDTLTKLVRDTQGPSHPYPYHTINIYIYIYIYEQGSPKLKLRIKSRKLMLVGPTFVSSKWTKHMTLLNCTCPPIFCQIRIY